jgi:hypothetical protein
MCLQSSKAKAEALHRITMSRRRREKQISREDYKESISLLSNKQQSTLIEYINRLSENDLSSTTAMIRNFAEEIIKKQLEKN